MARRRRRCPARFRRRRSEKPFTQVYALVPEHRRPTLAPLGLHDRELGRCRLCAGEILSVRAGRRTWHAGRALDDGTVEPNCLETLEAWMHSWKMQTRPNYGKAVIARRDGAKCKTCDRKRGRTYTWLELDHALALIDGGTWDEENLQLLCPDCHVAKTSREATERAARRRLAAY